MVSGSASVAVLTPEPLSCPRAACTPVTLQFSLPPASFARVVSASTLTALQPATCPLSTSSETGTLLQVLGQILWAAWGLGRSAPYPGTIWREEEVRATSYPLQLERPGQWKKARTPDAAPGLSTVPLLTSPPGFCLGRMASRVVFRHRWRPRPPAPDPGVTVKLAVTERACPSLRGPARPRVPGAGAGGQRQSRAWVLENSDGSQETARHWCDKAASKAGPRPRTEKEDSRTAALLTRHPQRGRGLVSVLPTRQQREGMSRSSTRIMTCPRNAISQNSENRA